jgi:hypothetical protein
MSFCVNCGSNDLLELTIEKGEAWIYCYKCKNCYGDPPSIPLETFVSELKEQGFPKDAERISNGLRASEEGE